MLLNVPDSSFTSNSEASEHYAASRSRIRETVTEEFPVGSCWSAAEGAINPWIQVDLLHNFQVGKIATQGRASLQVEEWVTEYKLSYGLLDTELRAVLDDQLNERTFTGNTNRFAVEHLFTAVLARFVRLTVLQYHGDRASLRWDLYACFVGVYTLAAD